MKRILRHPATNAVCVSLFTAFYAFVFILSASKPEWKELLQGETGGSHDDFWNGWRNFLMQGRHVYIAYAMILITGIILFLLITRKKVYDEYHTSLLVNSLIISLVATLIAIALFYLSILFDSGRFIEKFTLFVTLNWITVVFCDLGYILVCRKK